LYLKSEKKLAEFPTHSIKEWHYKNGYISTSFISCPCEIVKDNNAFMQSLRKRFSLSPNFSFCVVEGDFSEIEIKEMNEFISYLLKRKD